MRVSPSNPLGQEERLASLARGFHPRTLFGKNRASLRSHEGFTLEPSSRAATLPPYARKASRGSMAYCVRPLILVTFAALAARVPSSRFHALRGLRDVRKKAISRLMFNWPLGQPSFVNIRRLMAFFRISYVRTLPSLRLRALPCAS